MFFFLEFLRFWPFSESSVGTLWWLTEIFTANTAVYQGWLYLAVRLFGWIWEIVSLFAIHCTTAFITW